MKKMLWTFCAILIMGTAGLCSEGIERGVEGLDWKQSPAKSRYKLERIERLKDIESYCPVNPFAYPQEGVFKVYFAGKPDTKPVFWFYKKQFAELQLFDLDPELSLAALGELYGQPTKILENDTPEGLQRWDKGDILIEYVCFENQKAVIWFKHKELSKKMN